jgi:hypothetical protein
VGRKGKGKTEYLGENKNRNGYEYNRKEGEY